MPYKIFIETSYFSNMHTREKDFCSCYFFKVCESFLFGQIKKIVVHFGPLLAFFTFLENIRPGSNVYEKHI